MFISQIIGHPFFGIGESMEASLADAIAKVYNEDPTSLCVDPEPIPLPHGQSMRRVRATMESMDTELSLLMNVKELL